VYDFLAEIDRPLADFIGPLTKSLPPLPPKKPRHHGKRKPTVKRADAQVLAKMPLITVQKVRESDPIPLKASSNLPLSGIRAFGMGHVIAGGAMGRDLALYGADVLNI
jgi:hypothetical protein